MPAACRQEIPCQPELIRRRALITERVNCLNFNMSPGGRGKFPKLGPERAPAWDDKGKKFLMGAPSYLRADGDAHNHRMVG